MKKVLAITFCLFLAVCALTGCGTDMSDSPYLGTWSATTAEMSGFELSVEEIFGNFDITLNDNGKCDVDISGEKDSGSWSQTENGFSIEDEMEFVVDGDTAVLEYEGMNLYFERQ